jgi:Glycosyltransferase family 87
MPRGVTTAVAAMAFVGLVGTLSWHELSRKLAPPDVRPTAALWALSDFRANLYYPIRWFLDGGSPYDGGHAETYGTAHFPPYSPATLLVHLPFALPSLAVARIVWYVVLALLTVPLAALTLRLAGRPPAGAAVFAVATLVCLSRPGLWSLLLGQYTVPLVLGAYAAIALRDTRPWLAALGLAYTTIKPTIGAPLAALLLVDGQIALVARAAVLAAIGTLPVLALLAARAGGVVALVHQMQTELGVFSARDDVAAAGGGFRIDVSAVFARLGMPLGGTGELVVAIVVFTVGALAIRALRQRPGHEPFVWATILVLTVLLCTYHNAYDLVFVAWPLAAALLAPRRRALAYATVAALAFPAVNFIATGTGLRLLHANPEDFVGRLVYATNGLVLIALFVLTTGSVLLRARRG